MVRAMRSASVVWPVAASAVATRLTPACAVVVGDGAGDAFGVLASVGHRWLAGRRRGRRLRRSAPYARPVVSVMVRAMRSASVIWPAAARAAATPVECAALLVVVGDGAGDAFGVSGDAAGVGDLAGGGEGRGDPGQRRCLRSSLVMVSGDAFGVLGDAVGVGGLPVAARVAAIWASAVACWSLSLMVWAMRSASRAMRWASVIWPCGEGGGDSGQRRACWVRW